MLLPTARKSILTVTMVMTTCLIVIQCAKVQEEEEEVEYKTGIRDIVATDFQQSYNENQQLLVLLYRLDCDKCPEVLEILTKLLEHPELPSGLKIAKSFNNDLASRLGIERFPSLIYLRDKSHAIYDGDYDAKDLLEWIRLGTNKITQRLDDESFPSLIKNGVDETTDDWLVAFYKETCKNVLPVIETIGIRLYGKVKVAKVSIPESPRLTSRFEVTNCPEIIFFKQGEMYKFPSSTIDSTSLQEFVSVSYKNVKSESVQDAKVDTGFLAKTIAEYIKTYSREDKKYIVVACLCVLAASLLLLTVCCCRSCKKHPRKKAKKH